MSSSWKYFTTRPRYNWSVFIYKYIVVHITSVSPDFFRPHWLENGSTRFIANLCAFCGNRKACQNRRQTSRKVCLLLAARIWSTPYPSSGVVQSKPVMWTTVYCPASFVLKTTWYRVKMQATLIVSILFRLL